MKQIENIYIRNFNSLLPLSFLFYLFIGKKYTFIFISFLIFSKLSSLAYTSHVSLIWIVI